jgi:hypothetical protein
MVPPDLNVNCLAAVGGWEEQVIDLPAACNGQEWGCFPVRNAGRIPGGGAGFTLLGILTTLSAPTLPDRNRGIF